MLPLVFHLTHVPILLAGRGALAARRLRQMEAEGATGMRVFLDALPQEMDFEGVKLVMIAGLDLETSARLATMARAAGAFVNVEDKPHLCDFYFTANVRRGDLLIAVSTQGAVPALARVVRDDIAKHYGQEWEARTKSLAALRAQWRAQELSMSEITRRVREQTRAYA